MAVLFVSPYVYFTDDDGAPLAGGKVYTYAAGTTTPKATYTTSAATVENTNPVVLDASGRAVIFIDGAYKFTITDSADVVIRTVDNVTSFTTLDSQSDPFFESFSGNGTQTAFTMSEDLGTEEKSIYVWVDSGLLNHATNGTFATDTGWTKGTGWTIAAGVATATGAISTAIEQTAGVTLVAGESYNVTMTITRSAGSLTPSVGGVSGTARSSSATFTETIIAGSTQTIAFTGSGFTGTLDSVTVTPAVGRGYTIVPPTGYTINGTALTFNTAPATGTGNILVSAPLLSVGAASSAAAAAQAAEAAALAAADIAAAAAGFSYKYDTDTTASDPGAGFLRFNNATLASATALYISETTDDAQGIAAEVATWDNSTSTVRGTLRMFKQANPAVFAIFSVTGTITDNGSWDTVTVAYVSGSGSFSDNDPVTIQYVRNGDKGDTGATGATGATGNIGDIAAQTEAVVTASDMFVFADVDAANATRRDTVQGILDLVNSGDLVLLSTATASTSASLDFSSFITSTYSTYMFILSDVKPGTDNVDLYVRTSTDGGSTYDSGAGNYRYAASYDNDGGGGTGDPISAADTQIIVTRNGVGSSTGERLSGILRLHNPSAANYCIVDWQTSYINSGGQIESCVGAGVRVTAADVDAIRFIFSSGSITSGTIRMYGVSAA